MSISGAIVYRFDTDTDANIIALKTLVGINKMWAERPPETVAMPYIAVTKISTTPIQQSKNNSNRIDQVLVQFDCFDETLASVEAINEAIEDAYLPSELTITGRYSTGFPVFHEAAAFIDPDGGIYHGVIVLKYYIAKSPL